MNRHGWLWEGRSAARQALQRESKRARRRSECKVLRQIKQDPDTADEALIIEQNPEAEDPWRHD